MNTNNESTNINNNANIQAANIQAANEFLTMLNNNLNRRSLFDIFALEEMERPIRFHEQIEEMERTNRFNQQMDERRRLYALGQYQLEEGEILE